MAKKTDITKQQLIKIKKLASQGMTRRQIAYSMGWGKSTLYERMEKNPDVSDALKEGEAEGIEEITNALFESAATGNLGAQVFYLKNRAGWADRTEVSAEVKTVVTAIEVNFVE